MDVPARNNESKVFWTPILYDAPASWPWQQATRPVVLVRGPEATPESTAAVVSAAEESGVDATVARRACGPTAG
jgi:hypothetical protein